MRLNSSVDQFAALGFRDLLAAAGSHKLSSILLTLLLLPLLVMAVFLVPNEYDSYGQLLVRMGRGSVAMDPTTTLTQTISLQETRGHQVNSVKEMLQSRELTQRVTRRIGAERILQPHGRLEEWIDQALSWLPQSPPRAQGDMTGQEVADQLQFEAAVKKLDSMFNVSVAKDAYTIRLEVRSGDPFLSRDLLAALMDEYQLAHVQAHASTGSLEFFETQTEQLHRVAMEDKESLRIAKTSRGIIDIESSKASLRGLISQAESDLMTTQSEIAAAKSELGSLRDQIAQLPDSIAAETTTGIPKVTGSTMRQSLYDLEVRYKEMESKLKPGHPKLNALKEQLESSSAIARAEAGDQPQVRTMLNPVRQTIEVTLRTTESRLSGLQSKEASLNDRLQSLGEQLTRLNGDEVELAKLTWKASLSEQAYMKAAENRSMTRQLADLDRQQVSEIAIVQPATLQLKKVKPKRVILMVLAAALAVAIGVGQGIVRGLIGHVHRSQSDASRSDPDTLPAGELVADEFAAGAVAIGSDVAGSSRREAYSGVPR